MKSQSFDIKKIVDYWSIPHFLFGTVLALVTITFSLSVVLMFLATLYLAIFWELLEMRFRLLEAPGNNVTDILLALCSFVLTFLLIDQTDPNTERHIALLIVTIILFLCLNFFAWRARFEHDGEFQS